MLRGVTLARMETLIPGNPAEISTDKALEHLAAVCSSPFFKSSKRCQEFLRYVVTETIEGRGDQIKERNIAHEVFGKTGNFEPSEFSLVRVKAGEVRKRLDAYYRAQPETGIRIELPLGGYVPCISELPDPSVSAATPAGAAAPAAKPMSRRRFAAILGCSVGVMGGASLLSARGGTENNESK